MEAVRSSTDRPICVRANQGSTLIDGPETGPEANCNARVLCMAVPILQSVLALRIRPGHRTFLPISHREFFLCACGSYPAQGGTTVIPVVLVPITLSFEAGRTHGSPTVMDAAPDVQPILRSPVFARFHFGTAGNTQYADAMLRTMFPEAKQWHTLLGKPEIKPLKVSVPVGNGYVLTSKR